VAAHIGFKLIDIWLSGATYLILYGETESAGISEQHRAATPASLLF
jgi:hypothetical protein